MKKLLYIVLIIVFLSPCICLSEEFRELSPYEWSKLWHSSPSKALEYNREKLAHDIEENQKRFQERQAREREEERHQEQMEELRKLQREIDDIRMQQQFEETQRLLQHQNY